MARKKQTRPLIVACTRYHPPVLLTSGHPRKELMDRFGVRSARKVYRDSVDGETYHVGYIVAGMWWTLYNATPWEGKV